MTCVQIGECRLYNCDCLEAACKRIEKAYADRANPLFGDVAPKAVQLELVKEP